MIEQLKTIREALVLGIKAINHLGGAREAMPLHDAMPALAQLEAMVGEQEPVHWRAVLDPEQVPQQLKATMHVVGFREKKAAEGFVAEQIDFYGWRYTIEPLYVAPVAQQPAFDAQWALEAIEALLSNIRRDAPGLSGKAMGFAEEVAAALREKVAQQPQAEDTIKRQAQKIAELIADRDGWIEAHARLHREYHDFRKAAPQQAEAVPSSDLNPDEGDPVTLWAEIWRLREAVKGPDGYATWQDAATAERIRRVRAESKQAEVTKTVATHDDTDLIEQMLEALRSCSGVPHWPALIPTINAARKRLETPQQAESVPTKFKLGDTVRKTKGSQWHGAVVGTYSTSLTPEGYAVESATEKGSVQIYPASALELWEAPPQSEALSDDLRDRLVAIGQAIADQDDRAAQAMIREILAAPQQAEAVPPSNLIDPGSVVSFAVDRWLAEVSNRPLVNKNRRTLDDTWRQVILRFGGDPDVLLGPPHDELAAIAQQKGQP